MSMKVSVVGRRGGGVLERGGGERCKELIIDVHYESWRCRLASVFNVVITGHASTRPLADEKRDLRTRARASTHVHVHTVSPRRVPSFVRLTITTRPVDLTRRHEYPGVIFPPVGLW